MNWSKIEKLRALAERPGTEHEGDVARRMLEREEAKRAETKREAESTERYPADEMMAWAMFSKYITTKDMDVLRRALLEVEEIIQRNRRGLYR